MNCNKCGNLLTDADKFCPTCGTKVGDNESVDIIEDTNKKYSKKTLIVVISLIVVIVIAVSGYAIWKTQITSPVENVSNKIYKEAIADVEYYKSDAFYQELSSGDLEDDFAESLNQERDSKKEKLLEECSNEEEKTFVNSAYSVSTLFIQAAATKVSSDMIKEVNPYKDFDELDEKYNNFMDSVNECYDTLTNAESTDELEDLNDIY